MSVGVAFRSSNVPGVQLETRDREIAVNTADRTIYYTDPETGAWCYYRVPDAPDGLLRLLAEGSNIYTQSGG